MPDELAAAPEGDAGGRAGAVPGVRGLLEDAKKAEQAWRLLMESVKDFAILLVDADGRIASWNEGASRLFGYSAAEMIGRPMDELFVPEDRARGLPLRELKTAVELGRSSDDNWLLRKDGTRFWASGVTTPIPGSDRNPVGYTKVVRDLTERKLAEESLRKTNEMLEERVRARTAELELRLRELEGFSSSVAHDLRAPLRGIHRHGELVLAQYRDRPLGAEGAESVERILESARRMDHLIEHLLAYGRVGDAALQIEALALGSVLQGALLSLEAALAERGAQVQVDEPLPRVLADRDLLYQVLSNLLSNALKFVPADVTPRLRVRTEAANRGIRIVVEDNGIGIAPEHQDRIFLPFERLHGSDEYPGTGIGLAIVKRAAERMGGAVGLASEPGRGSRFWVDLGPAPAGGP